VNTAAALHLQEHLEDVSTAFDTVTSDKGVEGAGRAGGDRDLERHVHQVFARDLEVY